MQWFIFAFWPACCPCHTSLALCFLLGFGPFGMLFLQSDGPSQRSIWRPCTLLFIHVVSNSSNDGLEDAWGPFWRDTGRTIRSLDSCDEFVVCHCFPLLEPVGPTDEPHLPTRGHAWLTSNGRHGCFFVGLGSDAVIGCPLSSTMGERDDPALAEGTSSSCFSTGVLKLCPIPGVTIEKYKDNANCETIHYI
jgi:hypothetical protein